MKTDTIAAISTAMTNSGIGIIRISGEDAVSIVHSIFVNKKNRKCLSSYPSHTIHYGFILENDKNIIDEVMVSVMKAPNSYTMEDVVEINCHGGIFILKKIMNIVIRAGARTAEPGEFTKRAFLNGRIDLSRAEAVMDIISSKNEFALQSSLKQLKGSVSDLIVSLRKEILYEIALIESALDDPEHISLEDYPEKLKEKVSVIRGKLKKLLDSFHDGKILREGIQTVIIGKPNAGKSSLLNKLIGEDRAIVTEVAGTTRDILEEVISLEGITLNIIDTAGIRDTEDIVEKIGVEKTKRAIGEADLIIYMVDASVPLDKNDFTIMKMIEEKNIIILLNKSDLTLCVTEMDFPKHMKVIRTSMTEEEGINDFIDSIKKLFFHGDISYNDEVYLANIRQKESIEDAYHSLELVDQSIEDKMPEDFFSIDLMNAYAALGKIIGEEIEEDLIDEIFSKFCMGK